MWRKHVAACIVAAGVAACSLTTPLDDLRADADTTGTEGHPCFPNGTCLYKTLTCLSNVCVVVPGDASTDASDASEAGDACAGPQPPYADFIASCVTQPGMIACLNPQPASIVCSTSNNCGTGSAQILCGASSDCSTGTGTHCCLDGSMASVSGSCPLVANVSSTNATLTQCGTSCSSTQMTLCSRTSDCVTGQYCAYTKLELQGQPVLDGTAMMATFGLCWPPTP